MWDHNFINQTNLLPARERRVFSSGDVPLWATPECQGFSRACIRCSVARGSRAWLSSFLLLAHQRGPGSWNSDASCITDCVYMAEKSSIWQDVGRWERCTDSVLVKPMSRKQFASSSTNANPVLDAPSIDLLTKNLQVIRLEAKNLVHVLQQSTGRHDKDTHLSQMLLFIFEVLPSNHKPSR